MALGFTHADLADRDGLIRLDRQFLEQLAADDAGLHARLLAARRPTGAAKVLIGYLPYAEDETTFQEVEAALVAVAMRDGKPDAAVVEALKDRLAIRRGAAAAVLCQAGGAANYSAVRPLLKDERASVRLKAALGLVGAFDAEAIPVLIDLLADLTPRLRQQAEEYLATLAGAGSARILRHHVLPNIIGPIVVVATLEFK